MSDATEEHEIIEESPYAGHVDVLLDRFSVLVEHAQTIAFPPLRKGVTAPPDMTGWSKFRQIAFTVSSPQLTMLIGDTWTRSSLVLTVWLIMGTFWSLGADRFADHIFGTPRPTSPEPVISFWTKILALSLLGLILIWIPVAYWRWIEFFRDRRYPVFWRLVLTIAFIGIVVSSPYWALNPEYRVQFPSLLLQDRVKMILFVINYLLFVIPAGTFSYVLMIDILVLGGWLLLVTLKYLWSAHDPFPKKLTRRLVLEPIPTNESMGKEWRLTELTKAELESLRRWAAANREGTNNRLLPTALLLGVLGVFADTQAFSDAIDKVLTWLSNFFVIMAGKSDPPMLSAIGTFLTLGIVSGLVVSSIQMFLLLFRNLVTQSLIIEACIVAEYAREQCQGPDSKAETDTNHGGFWARILRLLWKR